MKICHLDDKQGTTRKNRHTTRRRLDKSARLADTERKRAACSALQSSSLSLIFGPNDPHQTEGREDFSMTPRRLSSTALLNSCRLSFCLNVCNRHERLVLFVTFSSVLDKLSTHSFQGSSRGSVFSFSFAKNFLTALDCDSNSLFPYSSTRATCASSHWFFSFVFVKLCPSLVLHEETERCEIEMYWEDDETDLKVKQDLKATSKLFASCSSTKTSEKTTHLF